MPLLYPMLLLSRWKIWIVADRFVSHLRAHLTLTTMYNSLTTAPVNVMMQANTAMPAPLLMLIVSCASCSQSAGQYAYISCVLKCSKPRFARYSPCYLTLQEEDEEEDNLHNLKVGGVCNREAEINNPDHCSDDMLLDSSSGGGGVAGRLAGVVPEGQGSRAVRADMKAATSSTTQQQVIRPRSH